jgi:hypothetical protein
VSLGWGCGVEGVLVNRDVGGGVVRNGDVGWGNLLLMGTWCGVSREWERGVGEFLVNENVGWDSLS